MGLRASKYFHVGGTAHDYLSTFAEEFDDAPLKLRDWHDDHIGYELEWRNNPVLYQVDLALDPPPEVVLKKKHEGENFVVYCGKLTHDITGHKLKYKLFVRINVTEEYKKRRPDVVAIASLLVSNRLIGKYDLVKS